MVVDNFVNYGKNSVAFYNRRLFMSDVPKSVHELTISIQLGKKYRDQSQKNMLIGFGLCMFATRLQEVTNNALGDMDKNVDLVDPTIFAIAQESAIAKITFTYQDLTIMAISMQQIDGIRDLTDTWMKTLTRNCGGNFTITEIATHQKVG